MASVSAMVRWVSGSNMRRVSISSSNKSMRMGSTAPMGKMSISEPRTAYSPRSVTVSAARYPALAKRSRSNAMSYFRPVAKSSVCPCT